MPFLQLGGFAAHRAWRDSCTMPGLAQDMSPSAHQGFCFLPWLWRQPKVYLCCLIGIISKPFARALWWDTQMHLQGKAENVFAQKSWQGQGESFNKPLVKSSSLAVWISSGLGEKWVIFQRAHWATMSRRRKEIWIFKADFVLLKLNTFVIEISTWRFLH